MIKLALGVGAFFILLSAAAVEVRSVFDLTSVPRVVADVRTEHGDRLPEGGLVIEVAEGETRLTHPLVFDASLSGEPGRPVVVRAIRRGASVVSGGTRLAWRSLRANEAPLLPSSNRVTFCVWNYVDRDSALLPSGLLGPVRLIFHTP